MKQAIFDKIAEQMTEGLYLGASLALYYDGVWQEYYLGEAEEGQLTRPGLVYDMASVSKVLGVATVLIPLIQCGQIDLDAPLKRYYAAVDNEQLTIRELVTHTSGIDPFIPHRDELDAEELRAAINAITVTSDKSFRYTDLNLILLGFMLEEQFGQSLDALFSERIFEPWRMIQTSFGPIQQAVPTVKGQPAGIVHDPKARVLGVHTGSAGLFSSLADLEIFLTHYLQDDFAADLSQNVSEHGQRSIVWDLDAEGWLSHTGYTGPFISYHRDRQLAVVFLTNRTYYTDDRARWITKRIELMACIQEELSR